MPRKTRKKIQQAKRTNHTSQSTNGKKFNGRDDDRNGLISSNCTDMSTNTSTDIHTNTSQSLTGSASRLPFIVFVCGALLSTFYQGGKVASFAVNTNIDIDIDVGNTDKGIEIENSNDADSSCSLYVAKSTIINSGLGIFTTTGISRGEQVGPADIVIQLPDPNPHFISSINVLAYDYLWEGQETGGQYEGQKVYSVVPGIGMLANGHVKDYNTIVSQGTTIDTAGIYRRTHPGAGASSHYVNHSFYANKDVPVGGELFVNYGSDWFNEREKKERLGTSRKDTSANTDINANANIKLNTNDNNDNNDASTADAIRSEDWLSQNGICLDNIKVGISSKPEAGRGAFATRGIAKGRIVAPAPVVQITDRRSLELFKVKTNSINGDSVERTDQLLLNYCFGHRNSSILLLPIAPLVNFINHDSIQPNVELRWSNSTQHDLQHPMDMSIQDIKQMKHAGLMLEFIALRDIQKGDEIFLNYGDSWDVSWKAHVSNWQREQQQSSRIDSNESNFHTMSTYATIVDNASTIVRTQQEQQHSPYPENLFTSCYYNYNYHKKKGNIVRWKMSNMTLFDRNLRPCIILDRKESIVDDGTRAELYTVAIRNRYGLAENQRIPSGETHIVSHIPRFGIKFTSKLYTSDQHLSKAFRHEIGLSDDIFPKKWLDLYT